MSTLLITDDQPVVDLSMPIEPHWRFSPTLTAADKTVSGYPFRSTALQMGAHGFTHVDAVSHVSPTGTELGSMDTSRLWGRCTVLDLSHVGPARPITAADLAAAAESAGARSGELVLLRTDQGIKHPSQTPAFWTESPYVSRAAAEWLLAFGPAAVGFDFPQDRGIRSEYDDDWIAGDMLDDWPCHELLLKAGIAQIEYLVNLAALPTTCLLFALPLNIPSSDGAPARVFALRASDPA